MSFSYHRSYCRSNDDIMSHLHLLAACALGCPCCWDFPQGWVPNDFAYLGPFKNFVQHNSSGPNSRPTSRRDSRCGESSNHAIISVIIMVLNPPLWSAAVYRRRNFISIDSLDPSRTKSAARRSLAVVPSFTGQKRCRCLSGRLALRVLVSTLYEDSIINSCY